jgi:hypothetical protein
LAILETHPAGDLAASIARDSDVVRLLSTAGWTRVGWPTHVGGLGGSPVLRAAIYDALAARGYAIPEAITSFEIIAPMLVRFAPHLAAIDLPNALAGDQVWCQGFSEPDAGSDLGSLSTRAELDGDGFVISGQKMWSSYGHLASRSCLLARTGDRREGHRSLTMFWVDLSAPGVTVVPTSCASGRAETAEIFLDEVRVPRTCILGEVGQGWAAVMYLMQFERGAYAWLRQAEMMTDIDHLLAHAHVSESPDLVAAAYLSLFALRSIARTTVRRLADGEVLGPESSVGKVLLATTEQQVADTARTLLWPALELETGDEVEYWRRRWAYSRITTIYGGAIEVQRDLVAERVLGLPRGH